MAFGAELHVHALAFGHAGDLAVGHDRGQDRTERLDSRLFEILIVVIGLFVGVVVDVPAAMGGGLIGNLVDLEPSGIALDLSHAGFGIDPFQLGLHAVIGSVCFSRGNFRATAAGTGVARITRIAALFGGARIARIAASLLRGAGVARIAASLLRGAGVAGVAASLLRSTGVARITALLGRTWIARIAGALGPGRLQPRHHTLLGNRPAARTARIARIAALRRARIAGVAASFLCAAGIAGVATPFGRAGVTRPTCGKLDDPGLWLGHR